MLWTNFWNDGIIVFLSKAIWMIINIVAMYKIKGTATATEKHENYFHYFSQFRNSDVLI